MRSFTVVERRNRLAHRHFLSVEPNVPSGREFTAAIVGWHATDPATPYLITVGTTAGDSRCRPRRRDLPTPFAGEALAMRRTLWRAARRHTTAQPQPGASDRVADSERRRLIADVEKSGVAADGGRWLDAACAAVRSHLGGTATPTAPNCAPHCPNSRARTTPRQRDWYLGEHRRQVFDTNGNAGPTAWWKGRVVGGWRQDADARVEVQLLEDISADGRKALSRPTNSRHGWPEHRISPRFPSPLSKAPS